MSATNAPVFSGALVVRPDGGDGDGDGAYRRVIDPHDPAVALSAAASPFVAFVTKQTNTYYRLLEAFLQDYCNYLERELDARVVVVLDGSEVFLMMIS